MFFLSLGCLIFYLKIEEKKNSLASGKEGRKGYPRREDVHEQRYCGEIEQVAWGSHEKCGV